ncbi:hypothetical protein T4D_12893 [Trichinella pseudospiralis]|uniref:Uncharacterized protein n=1 Tax=Trichinella pseudospiralis TaxID=6337 RepID=A0A0V1FQF4_TRIPS|nr:hypothetical protein T4D_12893 [Trichinella pseudospiralis]
MKASSVRVGRSSHVDSSSTMHGGSSAVKILIFANETAQEPAVDGSATIPPLECAARAEYVIDVTVKMPAAVRIDAIQ